MARAVLSGPENSPNLTGGRLIFDFLAELYRLDTQAMETVDPDGPGPLTGGYDPDFKEPVLVTSTPLASVGESVKSIHLSGSPVRSRPSRTTTCECLPRATRPRPKSP